MKSALTKTTLFLALFSAIGCDRPDPAAPHGHDHGGPGDVSVTHWTERTELFMEHPPLVAGESGRAAIHLTLLPEFTPLASGEATVTLRSDEGRILQFRGGATAPGIFGVDLAPDRPGVYAMTVAVSAPGVDDAHDLGRVTVGEAGASAPAAGEVEGEIAFLKEQQWTLEFGTAFAAVRTLQSSLTVPATVLPRSGGEAVVAAPVPGRVDPLSNVPVSGVVVHAGETLARILPLRDAAIRRAELVEATERHGLAVRELERVQRLVEGRALPGRRLEEARAELAASEAQLESARQRGGAFDVRAPFDGVVSDVRIAPGASVEVDEPLLRLVDPDRVHIVGTVTESDVAALRSVDSGELLLDDRDTLALAAPLSVGRVVDPVARTTEVRFAFDNDEARLPVGGSTRLRLFTGGEVSATAVPESAIVDDAGSPVVFVQTAGESFVRRPVRLGTRAAGWVEVVEGVDPGERVVHVGAYLIRLAAMSSQIPSHGHVH